MFQFAQSPLGDSQSTKKNRKHKRKILLPTKSEKEKHWKPIASKLISKPKLLNVDTMIQKKETWLTQKTTTIHKIKKRSLKQEKITIQPELLQLLEIKFNPWTKSSLLENF